MQHRKIHELHAYLQVERTEQVETRLTAFGNLYVIINNIIANTIIVIIMIMIIFWQEKLQSLSIEQRQTIHQLTHHLKLLQVQ